MKLYLPNGGTCEINYNCIIDNKKGRYLVTSNESNSKGKMVLEIIDGIVILYNTGTFKHTYTPPSTPVVKSEDDIISLIDVTKLKPKTISALRNKLNKYQVRTGTWRK